MRENWFSKAFALGLVLAAGPALAQTAPSAPGAQAPSGMRDMPMMQMMMQGQMDCPMMQRMAALDSRLRQLEERAGVPAPQAPAQPGSGTR